MWLAYFLKNRRLNLAAPLSLSLALGLGLAFGSDLAAQTFSPAEENSAGYFAPSFEVLTARAEPRPGGGLWARAAVNSAINLGAGLPAGAQVASAAPATAEPPLAFSPSEAAGGETMFGGGDSIEAALDEWRRQTDDDYQIVAVADPFLPLEDPQERLDSITLPVEAAWSPILRLDLNQLKLVAVTTISTQTGSALASFEDESGLSYLLRQGDRIGRNKGRIVKIDPAGVVIEERPQGNATARTVEMKLTI